MSKKDEPIKATMVLGRCGCRHEFQDARYGIGMRQHTIGKSTKTPPYRCTVCGREKHEIVR